MDHRKYVGGNWDTAGKKQLTFLVEEGLKPFHTLLDIGCGSLRAGRYFIDYLNRGKYHGIDHHAWLIEAGKEELGDKLLKDKHPQFKVSNGFSFESGVKVDYAIAKSVFTHLTKEKIQQCLIHLSVNLNGPFYASISEGSSKNNPKEDNDTKRFRYTVEEIKDLAFDWNVEVLGKRGTHAQTMLKFTLK